MRRSAPSLADPKERCVQAATRTKTFVIVPGAWDTPAIMQPILGPLKAAGHEVVVVDLPCEDADATLDQYAGAVRAVLPDDLSEVVLVGYSFGGFTATRVAIDYPALAVVYIAAWIPQPGVSVIDLFVGGDPFEGQDEEAGLAAFGGLIVSAGPGLCALNVEAYVAGLEPSLQDAARRELERTQRPQGIAVLREKWRGDLDITRRPGYILTTADTLVPPESQRAMAASIGARVYEIHTDHGTFREQPERLAELLVDAIDDQPLTRS
jgi:pimeloyl-ACP methyl ester carboxylesterase